MKTTDKALTETANAAGLEEYRRMLAHVARTMASGRSDEVAPYLDPQFNSRHVRLFVEGNVDKRYLVFHTLVPQLIDDEDFEDFEALADEFVAVAPIHAYASGPEECDAMLRWLEETKPLTPRQRDTIVTQRARFHVEAAARENRMGHVSFQERRTLNEYLLPELATSADLRIHLNPVRHWSRLETDKYLGPSGEPPADVVFYADAYEVGSAVFERKGRVLLVELAALEPCTLLQWAALSAEGDGDELESLCGDLARLGLIAFS